MRRRKGGRGAAGEEGWRGDEEGESSGGIGPAEEGLLRAAREWGRRGPWDGGSCGLAVLLLLSGPAPRGWRTQTPSSRQK